MLIDLKQTKLYLISPATGKYTARLLTVFQTLIAAGFSNIQFVRALQDPQGTTSLTRTNLEIFKRELQSASKEPFMILEDDCQIATDYTTIDIPDDTDAVYLGVSLWIYPHAYDTLGKGYHIRENGPNDMQSINDQLTRIHGMTSGHAILFKSHDYIRRFIQQMEPLLSQNMPHDLVYATMQPQSHVYALKRPMFYQAQALGGQEAVTRLVYNGQTYRPGT
jgi:hypothetical protein